MLQQIDGKIAVIETALAELRRRKLSLLQSQLTALQASLPPAKRGPGRPRRQPASHDLATGPVNTSSVSSAAPQKRRGRKPGKRPAGK